MLKISAAARIFARKIRRCRNINACMRDFAERIYEWPLTTIERTPHGKFTFTSISVRTFNRNYGFGIIFHSVIIVIEARKLHSKRALLSSAIFFLHMVFCLHSLINSEINYVFHWSIIRIVLLKNKDLQNGQRKSVSTPSLGNSHQECPNTFNCYIHLKCREKKKK